MESHRLITHLATGLALPLLILTHAAAAQTGAIHGRIVEETTAALGNATVRILPQGSGRTRYRAEATWDGGFHLASIEPGTYTIAISSSGFREKFLSKVEIGGRDLDLGTIVLQAAGCDAPGASCDMADPDDTPLPEPRSAGGEMRVTIGCLVDVDANPSVCSTSRNPQADFTVKAGPDQRVYLEPLNGAQVAEANSVDDCQNPKFGDHAVRVDGLGPGSDVCLRTSKGQRSHVFFTGEIEPDSKQVSILYVTRK